MLIKTRDWSRRGVLKAMAAGAALAPFVPAFPSEAAEGSLKRLLIFMSGHGLAHYNWLPSGTENNWDITPVLEPLSAMKDRMMVVAGLDHPAPMDGEAKHVNGICSILTGRTVTSDNKAAGISIDQLLAAEVGQDTQFDFLASSVANSYQGMMATGPSAHLSAETSPVEQFDRLFANLELDDSELIKLREDRGSVIDVVREDLNALEGRVGAEDRIKIEEHLSVIQGIEDDLATLGSVPGGCTIPPQETQGHSTSNDAYVPIAEAHARVLSSALACDLTRVAFMGYQSGPALPDIPGVDETLHDTAHFGAKPNKPEVDLARYTALSAWHAGQLASMAEQLDTFGALDDTLIVWCTFLRSTHEWHDMPITLVGGGNAGLGGGRFLDFGSTRTLNDLWISVACHMGLDIDEFGDPDYCTGPLTGIV